MNRKVSIALIGALVIGATIADLAGSAAFAGDTVEVGRADRLKAGYLLNFAKFVEWPASQSADVLTFCFAGGRGVHSALTTDLDRKRVGNRRLTLRALGMGDRPDGCAVLYMEAIDLDEMRRLTQLAATAVLTVSDSEGFVYRGGVIEIFTRSNRLHFNINVGSARRAKLHVSSILLQLATVVVQEDAS